MRLFASVVVVLAAAELSALALIAFGLALRTWWG
jgi:hypothetical protein